MRFYALAFLLSTAMANAGDYTHSDTVCIPASTTINVKLNTHTSELGYFTIDGCDGIQPTLGLQKNVEYRFVQSDISNYYHPLGLAYYADGAHAEVDELEPGIVPPGSSSTCGDDNLCPAPMYILDGGYLGAYSNNDAISPVNGDEDFGLDVYEPQFFATSVDWSEAGTYEVALKFDVDDFVDDIFYFCHIHNLMSGRIKWVDSSGNVLQEENTPEIPYEYEVASDFDQDCGTYGISDYQLPHPECPAEFVCDSDDGFSQCIDAMNCRMTAGMTTNASAGTAAALFIHMMIPHHRNAVNMAKALMYSDELECEDYASEEPDCVLKQIAMEIVAVQNHQIQNMQGIAEGYNYLAEDDCKVVIGTEGTFQVVNNDSGLCLTQNNVNVNSFVRLKECGSQDGQEWEVTSDGLLMNVASGKCMVRNGSSVKVAQCVSYSNRMFYKALDHSIALMYNGKVKVISVGGAGGSNLKLKSRQAGDDSQTYKFAYV